MQKCVLQMFETFWKHTHGMFVLQQRHNIRNKSTLLSDKTQEQNERRATRNSKSISRCASDKTHKTKSQQIPTRESTKVDWKRASVLSPRGPNTNLFCFQPQYHRITHALKHFTHDSHLCLGPTGTQHK